MKNLAYIFINFLVLGLYSFGGPNAHLGYFRLRFVEKLKWLQEEEFLDIVTLSQFLPGPSSSQVGFALGLKKGGVMGAICAFLGFTLPSFFILYFVATYAGNWIESTGIAYGFKLLSVIVVADVVISMYKKFCTTRLTASIAYAVAAILIVAPYSWMQIVLLLLSGLVAYIFRSREENEEHAQKVGQDKVPSANNNFRGRSTTSAVLFVLFLLALWLPASSIWMTIAQTFYHTGTLVFGGGHVVLPLLQDLTQGYINQEQFLTGYASAQAIPGPMFSLAAYLGSLYTAQHSFLGALLATVSIFLPGFLLLIAFWSKWTTLISKVWVQGIKQGLNAAVVGLLLSTLCYPIITTSLHDLKSIAITLCGFLLLHIWKIPVLWLVLSLGALGYFIN